MTLKKRRAVFYGLLAVFLVLGASAALYSTGWRLDLKTLKLQKVGGIFVRSYPADAAMRLNGKPIKNNSGFLQNGTLVGNLFPTNYKLELEADNFETWRGNIAVSPSMVTEVGAVMIPKNSTAVATGTIQKFWSLNDKVVVKDKNDNLLTFPSSPQDSVGAGKKIGRGDLVGWTNDSQFALILNEKTGIYSWSDAAGGTSININSALKKAGLTVGPSVNILADQNDKRRLIVLERTRIYLFDTEKSSLATIYKADAGAVLGREVASSQFYLAWTQFNGARNTSTLVVYDKFLRKPSGSPLEFKGITASLKWVGNKKIAVLQNDGGLYLYDVSSNAAPQKLADDVKSFSFADDASAVAALENSSLEIIPLNQNQDYHRFNLPEREAIKNVEWYADNNHIFVSYPDRVSLLDLNDAGLSNFTTVARGTASAYDSKTNRFYILKNDGLFGMDFAR